ncbi:MAG: homoserine dehydrogenase [Acidobacteria bacterium]|nr:homoserine dehydrogenase [Acidobacteriota bacterium]MBV9480339.1 homoserine dehydrogenase [Acidobacteriota bacterium]
MREYKLCLLGWGNVNRRLFELLEARRDQLQDQYGFSPRITGIATRRLGWRVAPEGFHSHSLPRIGVRSAAAAPSPGNLREWLKAAQADVLFEATSLNAQTGQPAIDHIRAALELGAHAITANKGPIVHGYEELSRLAAKQGCRFLFESTVMDGVPIFSTFRESLPLVRVEGFRGILNSTTNLMLTQMERGLSFKEALGKARDIGVAESDPADDIEAWDAAVKVAVLARVVMRMAVDLKQIDRHGIGHLTGEMVREARAAGHPYKLVCRASRKGHSLAASVRPEMVPLADPLAHVPGTSSIVYFETDIFPGLAISEIDPTLDTTAYGMLADFVKAVGSNWQKFAFA